MRRQGISIEGLVTFRNLTGISLAEIDAILVRYPMTVQRHVRALVKRES
jgi:hypothetical protein